MTWFVTYLLDGAVVGQATVLGRSLSDAVAMAEIHATTENIKYDDIAVEMEDA